MRQNPLVLLARLLLVVVLAGLAFHPAPAGPAYAARAPSLQAQAGPVSFAPLPILTVGAADGSARWGDYTNDGRLDALITGISNSEMPRTILFKNSTSGATITLDQVSSGMPDVETGSAAWSDYDQDGYLDVLLTGMTGFDLSGPGRVKAISAIYRNTADPSGLQPRVFVDINAGLPALYHSDGQWGDFDNDGDLDILLTGYQPAARFDDPPQPFAQVYRNNGDGSFQSLGLALPGAGDSAAAWADFDRDGWLDFAYIGMGMAGPLAQVYRNQGGTTFQPVDFGLPGMFQGAVAWVDVNADGWPDLFLSGNAGANTGEDRLPLTRLYLNKGGQLVLLDPEASGLPNLWRTSADWGDYDNDGDPDLLINGQTLQETFTRLYINNLNTTGEFVDARAGLVESADASVTWADMDQNGSLDILISGVLYEEGGNEYYATHLYRSSLGGSQRNLPPAAPTGLAACWDQDSQVTFLAHPPADDATPAPALRYNLRVGSAPGSGDVVLPPANAATGFHRLGQPGRWLGPMQLNVLQPGTRYYWSLQAVDSLMAGGPFAAERSFQTGLKITGDDQAVTDEDTPVWIDVLENDSSANGPVSLYAALPPLRGTASLQNDGIEYLPEKNFHGVDHFAYYAVDSSGYCTRGAVTVVVNPIDNDPPDDITLSNASVPENQPVGTLVGVLSAADPDRDPVITFSLPAGVKDNDAFRLNGAFLETNQVFDHETEPVYVIRVRAVDETELAFEKDLVIEITDLIDFPPALAWVDRLGQLHPAEEVTVWMSIDGQTRPFHLILAAGDPDNGDRLAWSIAEGLGPAHGMAVAAGTTIDREPLAIQYTPDPGFAGEDEFVVQVTDLANLTSQIRVRVIVADLHLTFLPLIMR